MPKDKLFKIAGVGLTIIALATFKYSDPFCHSNLKSLFLLGLSTIFILFPKRRLHSTISGKHLMANILTIFLVAFLLLQVFWAVRNPTNISHYGWMLVSICFITFNLLSKKENNKKNME